MKELQKYRVKSAYGVYRKGDIIQPTGMLRDELLMCGRIEKYVEPTAQVAPEPAIAAEPEPEPGAIVETATTPAPETAASQPRRKKRRHAG